MLKRRQFIGAGIGALSLAARGASGSKMRFAYSGTAFFGAGVNPLGDQFTKTDREMTDALKLCARFGYHGVEPFRGQGSLPDDLPKLKAMLAEAGLQLSTVSGDVDFEGFFPVLRENNYSYWVDLNYDAARKEEGTLEQQLAVNTRYLREKVKVELKTS